jgi:hypothetical protein
LSDEQLEDDILTGHHTARTLKTSSHRRYQQIALKWRIHADNVLEYKAVIFAAGPQARPAPEL